MQAAAVNIDAYIAEFPESTQALLQQMRETIQKAAPEATEAISYAMPTFKLHGNLVHFAGYKNHIGFYPGGIVAEFAKDLTKYNTSKGTIQFPLDKPLPLQLVTKITKYRVKQNLEKAAVKKMGKAKKVN
jgi:uncharacterized protein YdhG (YjbR/CyaY superfamily)